MLGEMLKEKKEKDHCKGLFWRAHINSFLSSHHSIEVKKSLRLLKRKSCPGCHKCELLWEHLQEDINCDPTVDGDYLNGVKDQKIYTFKINSSYDYESGYEEIDEIEFIEVKN